MGSEGNSVRSRLLPTIRRDGTGASLAPNGQVRRVIFTAFSALLCFSLVAACSSGDEPPGAVTTGIDIRATPDANGNSPVALDIVVPYSKAMMEQLVGVTAAEWFRRRQQYKRDFPTEFDITELEVVPGTVRQVKLELRNAKAAQGALIFANYFSEGVHRVRVDRLESITIELLSNQFLVRQLDGK